MMVMTSVSERPVTESGGTTGVLDGSLFGLRLREGANLRTGGGSSWTSMVGDSYA